MTRFAIPGHAHTDYGTREIEEGLPSTYVASNGTKVQSITWSFDNLPVASATDQAVLTIPANSFIESATLRVTEAFAGGTSYNIGLEETDGSTIDADGIDAAIALTAMDAVGETVLCNGALVGGLLGIGTAAGQVVIAATGTYTAGKAILDINYRTLDDRSGSNS